MATTAIIYDPGHHRVQLPIAVYPGGGSVVEVTRTRGAEVTGVPLQYVPLVNAARAAGASALQADAAAKAHAVTAARLALGAEAHADSARLLSAQGNAQGAFAATKKAQALAEQSHAAAVQSSVARAEQASLKASGTHLVIAANAVREGQAIRAQQAKATADMHATAPLRVVVPLKPQVLQRVAPALHPAAPVSPVPDATSDFARSRVPALPRIAPAAAAAVVRTGAPAAVTALPVKADTQAYLAARKAAQSGVATAAKAIETAVKSNDPARITVAVQAHAQATSTAAAVETKRANEVQGVTVRPTPSPAGQGFASKPSPAVPQRSSAPVDPNKGQIKSSTGLPISGPGWMDSVKAHVANTYTVPGGGIESVSAQSRYSTPGNSAGQKPTATRKSVKGSLGGHFEPGGRAVPSDRPLAGWGDTSRHAGMLAGWGFGALTSFGAALRAAYAAIDDDSKVDTSRLELTGALEDELDLGDGVGLWYPTAGNQPLKGVSARNKRVVKALRVVKAWQAAFGGGFPNAAQLALWCATQWGTVDTLVSHMQAAGQNATTLDAANYSSGFAKFIAKQQSDLPGMHTDPKTGLPQLTIDPKTGLPSVGGKGPGSGSSGSGAPATDGGKSVLLIVGGLALLAAVAAKG